jgi:hypothetical protein
MEIMPVVMISIATVESPFPRRKNGIAKGFP